MGALATVFEGLVFGASSRNPNDPRYWESDAYPTMLSSSGELVNPAHALRVSCMYVGVRLYAEIIGSLPLRVYRERGDGGKDEERAHELWKLLRRRPNEWQHGQQFRETLVAWAAIYQQALAQIVENRTGGIDALVPIPPEAVEKTEQLDNRRLRFTIRRENGTDYILTQDEVLRIDGFGFHHYRQPSVVAHARDAIGLWLAREKFSSLYFAQGANPSIAVMFPSGIAEESYTRAKKRMQEQVQGLDNAHKVLIGEHDARVHNLSNDPQKSQLVEQQEALVAEMARWVDLPPHMLGATKTTTYASVSEFGQEFVKYRLGPKVSRIEKSIERDLLVDEEGDVYVKMLMDALVRGNLLERYQAHAIGLQNEFLNKNEVRAMEDRNPVEGGDEFRGAANLYGPEQEAVEQPEGEVGREPAAVVSMVPRRLEAIARKAAERVFGQECRAVAAEAAKHASDPEAFRVSVSAWYSSFGARVADTLDLEPSAVRAYIERQRAQVVEHGVAALEDCGAVEELCRLALEDAPCLN